MVSEPNKLTWRVYSIIATYQGVEEEAVVQGLAGIVKCQRFGPVRCSVNDGLSDRLVRDCSE